MRSRAVACEPDRIGVRGDRVRRLGHLVARSAALGLLGGAAWLAPALALAEATASARPERRGIATAGLAFVLAMHLASGSQQLAALTLATCLIWLVARAGARGARSAAIGIAGAFCLAAVALLPRLEMLRLATASGYVDPDGIGSLVLGDARALVGRFGVSRSEIATLYLGAATPRSRSSGCGAAGAKADRCACSPG